MADRKISEKRIAPEINSGINGLIAAANRDDRFKLLEDDCVLAGNLENDIHPIFGWFDCDGPMKQMLRLASQFLAHDSVLVFFVPLLYGRELTQNDSNSSKTYLSDPLANASLTERQRMLAGVRQALQCVAHSVELRSMRSEKRMYARTLTKSAKPVHTSACFPAFQRRSTAVIEIADRFMHFYSDDDNGYKVSSRCAQFRHDFLFASTLVHEIVHAVGVTRRGNLIEPCIRVNDPEPEWGYAWEQFIFGCVINPQDRTKPGTYVLMRKIWADCVVAEKAGGKEYSDVPMSYIAQWFRQESWDVIVGKGPTAIPPPVAHFKIQSSRKYGAWVISTDCINIKADIVALHQGWKRQCESLYANSLSAMASSRIFWRFQNTEALQRSNVPTPPRVPWSPQIPQGCFQTNVPSHSTTGSAPESKTANRHQVLTTDPTRSSRKRKAVVETDFVRVSKSMKR
jgi:hypothetical protein